MLREPTASRYTPPVTRTEVLPTFADAPESTESSAKLNVSVWSTSPALFPGASAAKNWVRVPAATLLTEERETEPAVVALPLSGTRTPAAFESCRLPLLKADTV